MSSKWYVNVFQTRFRCEYHNNCRAQQIDRFMCSDKAVRRSFYISKMKIVVRESRNAIKHTKTNNSSRNEWQTLKFAGIQTFQHWISFETICLQNELLESAPWLESVARIRESAGKKWNVQLLLESVNPLESFVYKKRLWIRESVNPLAFLV